MKRRSIRYPNLSGNMPTVVPVVYGGTGVSTEEEAIALMNAVPESSIGMPGGPARLVNGKLEPEVFEQEDGQIPSSVKVTGPNQLTVNAVGTYTITNHDTYTEYTVSASLGTVSMQGDTITYTAPATPGIAGFTINGRSLQVAIGAASVSAPTMISPVNQSTGLSASVTLTSSGFFTLGASDTHEGSDWQVSANANFTALLFSSVNNSVSKTSYALTGLSANTLYYARVRHKGTTLGYSAWSPTISFTTKSSFVPTTEVAVIQNSPANQVNNSLYGSSMSASDGGKTLIFGSPNWNNGSYTNQGAIYFYRESSNNWILEKTFTGPPGSYYGRALDISSDGETYIYGVYHLHVLYVKTRNNGSWEGPGFQDFGHTQVGWSVAISGDGNTAAYHAEPSSAPVGSGGFVVRSKNTTTNTWSGGYLLEPGFSADGFLGSSLALSYNGDIAVVGVRSWSQYQRAYIYRRSGNTWVLDFTINAPSGHSVTDGSYFGSTVAVSNDGSVVAVAATSGGNSIGGSGFVCLYSKINNTWTRIATVQENSSRGTAQDFTLSHDGTYLSVSFSSKLIRIYKRDQNNAYVYEGGLIGDINGTLGVDRSCFSRDFSFAARAVSGGAQGTLVKVFK